MEGGVKEFGMLRMTRAGALLRIFALGSAMTAEDSYVSEIQKSRRETDEFLRSEKSPLLLIGRFDVRDGASSIGSDPGSAIVLPARAPQRVGTLIRHGDQLSFEIATGVPVTVNDKPASGTVTLQAPDMPKPSDRVGFGDFVFAIRPSADNFYLLVKDKRSQFLRDFQGTTWFPVDPAYRVIARFAPYESAKTVSVPYTAGAAKIFTAPGDLVFRLGSQELRLQALASGEGLLVMFKDRTSGKETYGGGRFLEADLPKDGKTTVDFNKAYNPYCAVNPYAACPVPPAQNRLPVRVLAGETYKNHH
jgi:uncharacterized protein (DUF1684 family)